MDDVKKHKSEMQAARRNAVIEIVALVGVMAALFTVGAVMASVTALLAAMGVGLIIGWRVA